MGIVGAILMLACGLAVIFGPDDGNALPWLIVGILGLALWIGAAVDAFVGG